MKKNLILFTLLLLNINLFAQISYTGYIDKYPVEFVIDRCIEGKIRAFYVYTKFDDPIKIEGTLKNELLTLNEKDSLGKNVATLVFKNVKSTNAHLEGIWKDLKTKKALNITLTKSFDVDNGEDMILQKKELLQGYALKDKYFKLVVGKPKADLNMQVIGLKIFEKKTDKLLQYIDLGCQLWGFENITIDDYNFDGIMDFSTCTQTYAGPNTSATYFLYDSKTGKYFKSSFEGISLEFDQNKKRIYERNQCCAGRSVMNAEYKVVNNKMVLIKKTCLELNEKTDKYKIVKCE